MSFSNKKFTACFASITLALLTSCSGQSATDTLTNGGTSNQTSQTLSSTPGHASSTKLLDSLAVLYPNGQLPANRTAQASQDLSQNPAALKLTAETVTVAKDQNTTKAHVTAQAAAADYQPVQRVQNTTLYGAYFFSIYPSEVTSALEGNPNWVLEGPAFSTSLVAGLELYPVHRFRNKTNGSYLYSIYETERADIATNYSTTFEYEGVAWYARQTPATGWSALYRFRNKTNGTYLFSAYESEKDAIVANYPAVFELEGIAYYVRQDSPSVAAGNRIALGPRHTCALKNYGTVSCWGFNDDGQLGDGTTAQSYSPITVPGLTGVVSLAAGSYHTCALKSDGTVLCWGLSQLLGINNTTSMKLSPTAVPSLTGVTALSAGSGHTCALKSDGTVFCWGYGGEGQIGDGTTTYKPIPTAVAGLTGVTALSAGLYHTCAVKSDSTVACWGDNVFGQLGDGSTVNKSSPSAVIGLTNVTSVSANGIHTCALKSNATVTCWGDNRLGQLGDGTTTPRLIPTTDVETGVKALTGGIFHTCAIKNDGTLRCWGNNNSGQLGIGAVPPYYYESPLSVTGLTSGVTALVAGYYGTCALKNDGKARCWGGNSFGQLGDGTTTNRSSPTVVLGGAVFWQ